MTRERGKPRLSTQFVFIVGLFAAFLFPSWTSRAAGDDAHSTAPKAEVAEVVIVYKTHFDIGYSHLAKEVVKFYRTDMIRHALGIVDKYQNLPPEEQFVWTIPGWPMKQILWDGQTPDIRARLEKAIRSGNIVMHAHPFSMHTETAELEDLVRGLGFSAQISRAYGQPLPRASKMTDVPSHTWVLPTLLKHAGIEFLHIGCNDASHPARVPMLFWWEGPDGSRVLTMYSPRYGSEAVPPRDWPYPAWLWLHMTGDNQGPPSPETLMNDLNFVRQKLPRAKVKVGRLEDFADAILAAKCDLPVVRGDMPDQWVHGPASAPKNWQNAAVGRAELPAAETLATLNRAWGVWTPDPKAAIAEGYEKSILLSEHTWGAADQGRYKFKYVKKEGDPYMTTDEVDLNAKLFMESTWDEHTAYATSLREIADKALRTQLAALARNVGIEGERIVVFNSLPWPRSDQVEAQGGWGDGVIVTDDAGAELPDAVEGTSLKFIARDVPAMGYRTYRVANRSSAPKPAADCAVNDVAHTIESPFFKVAFDPARGRVSSLVDKRTGREWVDDSGEIGCQHFYERFSKKEALRYRNQVLNREYWNAAHADMHARAWIPDESQQPYVAVTPSNMVFSAAVTPLGVTATLSCPASATLPHAVTWTLVLYRDLPQADLTVDISHKKEEGWPEALWVSLPFKIAHPLFHIGRVGSIINPATDIIPDTNHRFCWSDFGVTVADAPGDGAGIGLCPVDTPGISLGEPGLMRFDNYTPDKARVFVNLINNVWHTNFRTWYHDDIHSHIRLWTFKNYDAAAALVTPGFDAKRPLLAVVADGPGGKLPPKQAGLSVSRTGVLVTAFGDNPDGPGTLLRVWEQSGVTGRLVVTLPGAFKSATPISLRGDTAGQPIRLRSGRLSFNLHAYAPASFLIQ